MQKIMFNDKYGLTEAVLQGRKTMTRRVIKPQYDNIKAYNANCETYLLGELDGETFEVKPCYYIGEKVAIAQSYKSIFEESLNYALPRYHWLDDHIDEKGFENKIFVKASEMPHRIRITDIKVERLRDISNEDCLKEGICNGFASEGKAYGFVDRVCDRIYTLDSPREAFAALIDKVSGRGTWDRNPWVFAYSFELVK